MDPVSVFRQCFPLTLVLETDSVLLRLLRKEDQKSFSGIAVPEVLWKYFTRHLNDPSQLDAWVEDALNDWTAERRIPFTIIEKSGGTVCGSTSLGSISFFDRRIEIGWTWLGEAFRGTQVNRHCKFLLLQFAFERLQMERVEIKTDNLNGRAKAALRKIGAKEEGILRSHMLMPGGRRRDSVYFSILKEEWPAIRESVFKDL
jgi:RimJ/RimL family protein N-acetyltransferase